MLSLLKDELSNVGLEMHALKTKILSNQMQNQYRFVDIGDMMIEILSNEKSHKYLGRNINLFAEYRTECEVNHRLQLAWAKFSPESQMAAGSSDSSFTSTSIFRCSCVPYRSIRRICSFFQEVRFFEDSYCSAQDASQYHRMET